MLPQLFTPVNTIQVMMVFGYIFRTENLLYMPKYIRGHLYYSGLPNNYDEMQCLEVFPYFDYKMKVTIS